jgi:large conductance mechanosensitive channel
MLKEFKTFAMKGNMLDMAVGLILGAAFGTVVKSVVDEVIMPLVASVTGAPDFTNLFIVLRNETGDTFTSLAAAREAGAIVVGLGLFVNALIAFLLVALVLFFVVKGANRLKHEEETKAAAPAEPPADVKLLGEIRDLLKAK